MGYLWKPGCYALAVGLGLQQREVYVSSVCQPVGYSDETMAHRCHRLLCPAESSHLVIT